MSTYDLSVNGYQTASRGGLIPVQACVIYCILLTNRDLFIVSKHKSSMYKTLILVLLRKMLDRVSSESLYTKSVAFLQIDYYYHYYYYYYYSIINNLIL